MFNRHDFKSNAKAVLLNNYWKCFFVTLIYGILTSAANSSGASGGTSSDINNGYFSETVGDLLSNNFVITAIFSIAGISLIISLAVAILKMPLDVGLSKFFINNREGHGDIGDLFYGFGGGRFLKSLSAIWAASWRIFAWYCLFIIPGIVKMYEYSQVSYIVAQNPDIDVKRALELSRAMTKGEKFNLFILDISFWGWYILGILAFFVGVIFVTPYVYATKAEVFVYMCEKAVTENFATREELYGFDNYED